MRPRGPLSCCDSAQCEEMTISHGFFAGGLGSQALQLDNINSLLSLHFCSPSNGEDLTLPGPGTSLCVCRPQDCEGCYSGVRAAAQPPLGPCLKPSHRRAQRACQGTGLFLPTGVSPEGSRHRPPGGTLGSVSGHPQPVLTAGDRCREDHGLMESQHSEWG